MKHAILRTKALESSRRSPSLPRRKQRSDKRPPSPRHIPFFALRERWSSKSTSQQINQPPAHHPPPTTPSLHPSINHFTNPPSNQASHRISIPQSHDLSRQASNHAHPRPSSPIPGFPILLQASPPPASDRRTQNTTHDEDPALFFTVRRTTLTSGTTGSPPLSRLRR